MPQSLNTLTDSTDELPESSSTPRISIVMPVYKERPAILARTLESISHQTFHDYELIIVVDDPANTEAIALFQELANEDARVRFVINEKNLGVWPSYNRGIRLARGEYLAIQDADDVSLPHRLTLMHEFLRTHPDVDIVGAALEYVSESDNRSLLTRYYPSDVRLAINRYCPMAHGTTLRKRRLHEHFGYYDESPDIRHAADYELWIRWHLQGVRFANIPEVVYKYYQSDVNFKNQNVRKILCDTIAIKRRHAHHLHFGFLDYLFLLGERLTALLPSWTITRLFYKYNAWRARRMCRKVTCQGAP